MGLCFLEDEMDKQTAEQIYVRGWFAAACAYGGPAEENEEEEAKEHFAEDFPSLASQEAKA